MSIYKPCDIRGDCSELSPNLYRQWGYALGLRLSPGSSFVAGGDVRTSTPAFLDALTNGFCRAGMCVVNLGILPTPMVYFAARRLNALGCAIVTASHSPPSINGLKWMVDGFPPDEKEVQSLSEFPAEENEDGKQREGGAIEELDIEELYCEWLCQAWAKESASVNTRIILDPGNGAWCGRALRVLQKVFPNTRLLSIHDRADGTFPDRDPDSSSPAHLTALSDTVRREHADLGIAFDGDGDRVSFVDSDGQVLTAEETTWILLQTFGQELQESAFVHDIKFSDRIPEAAREQGAHPMPQRSGHAFIRTRMIESSGCFGAEISGHYFYGALNGGDDGLYTACRVITHLSKSCVALVDLRRACFPVYMTPDLRLAVELARQDQVLDGIREAFSDRPQITVDGVRVNFPDGWALVRKSVTESKLTFRFEGNSTQSLDRIVRAYCSRLPELGHDLYAQYERKDTL